MRDASSKRYPSFGYGKKEALDASGSTSWKSRETIHQCARWRVKRGPIRHGRSHGPPAPLSRIKRIILNHQTRYTLIFGNAKRRLVIGVKEQVIDRLVIVFGPQQ
jgi:hypothetical protein